MAGTTASKRKADLKIVMLGSMSVGKTCLVTRYIQGSYDETCPETIGAAFFLKQYGPYNVAVWDTAGQERFSGLSAFYCRDAGAAIMAYDSTSRDSFLDLRKRFLSLLNSEDDCLKVIVGTKIDLIEGDDRVVSKEEAQAFAKEINAEMFQKKKLSSIPFFETSSKKGHNINEVFTFVLESCLGKLSEEYQNTQLERASSRLQLSADKGTSKAAVAQENITKKKCC